MEFSYLICWYIPPADTDERSLSSLDRAFFQELTNLAKTLQSRIALRADYPIK